MPGLLLTPEQGTTQAHNGGRTRTNTNTEWSFSFRGGWCSDTDSSDEEVGHSGKTVHNDARAKGASSQTASKDITNTKSDTNVQNGRKDAAVKGGESEETRMLRELDIASRAENDTAQFKATPWSIARVNAAVSKDRAPPAAAAASTASSANSSMKVRERISRRDDDAEDAVAEHTSYFELRPTQDASDSSIDMTRTEPVPVGPCSGGLSAGGGGAKKTVQTPKIGKTIERFFAVRKLGKANSDRKLTTPYINNWRIHNTSLPGIPSRSPQQGTTLNLPYTPSDRSQPGSSLTVLDTESSFDQDEPDAYARRVSPMPTASINYRPAQSAVEVVSKGSADSSAEYVSFMSGSTDGETLDGPVAYGDETNNYIYDVPFHDPGITSLEPSNAHASKALYEGAPATYTRGEPFVDAPRAYAISPVRSTAVQSRYQLANSQSRMSRGSLSSPAYREKFRLTTAASNTGIRRPVELSSDDDAANVLPRLDSMRYSQQEVARPAYMQSFSSPIRVTARKTRRSGRAALGLEPLGSDISHGNSQSIQMRRSHSPLSAGHQTGDFVPHYQGAPLVSSRVSNHPEPVHVEEYDYKADLSLVDPAPKISIPTYKAPYIQDYTSPRSSFSPPRTLADSLRPSKRSRELTPRESDAYDAFVDDEEASWSTLPQRKKPRTQHTYEASSLTGSDAKSMRQSGRFKLPIALPSLVAKSVSDESTSTGKKRVVKYLPPPRDAEPVLQSTSGLLDERPARYSVSALLLPESKTQGARNGSEVTQNAAVKDPPVKVMKPVSVWSIKRIGNQYKYRPGALTNSRSVNVVSSSVQPELVSSGAKTTTESKAAWEYSDPQVVMRSCSSSPVRKRAREIDVSRGRRLEDLDTSSDDKADAALCHSSSEVKKSTREDRTSSYESSSRIENDGHVEEGDEHDISIALDIDALEYSYPQVRKTMLERRAASSAVWDDLGLPSCGVPFVDASTTSTSALVNKQYEIAIVVWNGLSTNHYSSPRRDQQSCYANQVS